MGMWVHNVIVLGMGMWVSGPTLRQCHFTCCEVGSSSTAFCFKAWAVGSDAFAGNHVAQDVLWTVMDGHTCAGLKHGWCCYSGDIHEVPPPVLTTKLPHSCCLRA